ncbi:MAG: ATP-dependent zinc metalloprotease FtsH, partial [Oscillospiraceae bacterium]|nr:ATP-dependent zinc metalloprotease FtsH [Oscillospiraceae bacterium]
ENLTNEAALLAARADRKAITNQDIAEATIKVVAGPEKKSRVKTEREVKLTAYHEAGHAICTYYCPHQDKVHQISIIPRGMAGGYTLSLPEHDKSYNSLKEMHEEIIVLLGGRVAEKLIMDDISTGASNDLERATQTARNMITRYGFSEKLGPVVYGNDQSEPFLGRDFSSTPNYSNEVAAEIDAEIRNFVEQGYAKAEEILRTHIDQLHTVAQYLIKHEKIEAPEFEKLMKGESLETAPEFSVPEPSGNFTENPVETSVSQTQDFTEE